MHQRLAQRPVPGRVIPGDCDSVAGHAGAQVRVALVGDALLGPQVPQTLEAVVPGAARDQDALGLVAHNAVLQALTLKRSACKFAHGARHVLPHGRILHDSYHCSRYNTQTRRLTEPAFHAVFEAIRADLKN